MAKYLDLLLGGLQFHKFEQRSSNTFQITAAHIFELATNGTIGNSLRCYATRNIHPSACATARTGGVLAGLAGVNEQLCDCIDRNPAYRQVRTNQTFGCVLI